MRFGGRERAVYACMILVNIGFEGGIGVLGR
jgi:hypothetical protein